MGILGGLLSCDGVGRLVDCHVDGAVEVGVVWFGWVGLWKASLG